MIVVFMYVWIEIVDGYDSDSVSDFEDAVRFDAMLEMCLIFAMMVMMFYFKNWWRWRFWRGLGLLLEIWMVGLL